MTKLQALKSITFAYDVKEDRVLAAINPGHANAWSCWLTRRLALALLERVAGFIENTSALVKKASADVRGELAAFERDAAIARTAQAMSNTPPAVLKTSATAAELAKQLTISNQGDGFRMELQGEGGGSAAGLVTRAEMQRILQMLQAEVVKCGWLVAPGAPAAGPAVEEAGPKPSRH